MVFAPVSDGWLRPLARPKRKIRSTWSCCRTTVVRWPTHFATAATCETAMSRKLGGGSNAKLGKKVERSEEVDAQWEKRTSLKSKAR